MKSGTTHTRHLKLQLEYCPRCGAKLDTDASYCHMCGVEVKTYWQPNVHREIRRRRRDANEAIWGAISFFAVLVIIGLTFVAYPDLLGRVWSYFNELVTLGKFVLPPESFGQPLIYFLNLSGAWGLFFGVVAAALGRSLRQALGDVIGAFFAFYLASILTEFYAGIIHGTSLALFGILGLVVVIIANIVVWAILLAYRSSFRSYVEHGETPSPKL